MSAATPRKTYAARTEVPAEKTRAEIERLQRENARLRHGKDRFKAGVRSAITWLHGRASAMVDPKARDVLNSAATNLGMDLAAQPSGGERVD